MKDSCVPGRFTGDRTNETETLGRDQNDDEVELAWFCKPTWLAKQMKDRFAVASGPLDLGRNT